VDVLLEPRPKHFRVLNQFYRRLFLDTEIKWWWWPHDDNAGVVVVVVVVLVALVVVVVVVASDVRFA